MLKVIPSFTFSINIFCSEYKTSFDETFDNKSFD